MYRRTRIIKAQKLHKENHGKRGFTLVELCVVLALLAILTTMTVSFSVLMNGSAAENKAEYEYLEDCAAFKNELTKWSANHDAADSVFAVAADGTLSVTENGAERPLSFSNGVLILDTTQIDHLDAIEGVTFSSNGQLIKCVMHRHDQNGKRLESSFVFSTRCGSVQLEEVAHE